jgi:hypothetical protein
MIGTVNGGHSMNRILAIVLSTVLAAAAALGADLTYEQKTEITGGSMKQMMSMLGRFSKGAAGPTSAAARWRRRQRRR